MQMLYTDLLPLELDDGMMTIRECLRQEILKAERIEIAVGYVSRLSLLELNELIHQKCSNIERNICLNIGMYYIDGIPESSYYVAKMLNTQWQQEGIGEIRIVNAFKFHGKIYCFYKNESPVSSIIGSANLGVLKLEANNRRQYEVSAITKDPSECREIAQLVEKLKDGRCSVNISKADNIPIIREQNTSLDNVKTVSKLNDINVEFYKSHLTNITFSLPLKVPRNDEKLQDDGRHYTKSNLNVCYSPDTRNKMRPKSRNWYETQLTVSRDIYTMAGYPKRNEPFYVVTDDGYRFKAHTTSDNNKQFSAVGDEHIMGRWIKGRLVAAGLVEPVNDTMSDTKRQGMITRVMLDTYGRDCLVFTKTDAVFSPSPNDREYDVWYLSFETAKDF